MDTFRDTLNYWLLLQLGSDCFLSSSSFLFVSFFFFFLLSFSSFAFTGDLSDGNEGTVGRMRIDPRKDVNLRDWHLPLLLRPASMDYVRVLLPYLSVPAAAPASFILSLPPSLTTTMTVTVDLNGNEMTTGAES